MSIEFVPLWSALSGATLGGIISFSLQSFLFYKQNKRDELKENKEDNHALNILFFEVLMNTHVFERVHYDCKRKIADRVDADMVMQLKEIQSRLSLLTDEKWLKHDEVLFKLGKESILFDARFFYKAINNKENLTLDEIEILIDAGLDIARAMKKLFEESPKYKLIAVDINEVAPDLNFRDAV